MHGFLNRASNFNYMSVSYIICNTSHFIHFRLLDMGFEKNVSEIVSVLGEKGPEDRQTILLSATLSEGLFMLSLFLIGNIL